MRYTVVVTFIGECCPQSHLWIETVEANTPREARCLVMQAVRDAHGEPHETVACQGSVPFGTITDVKAT